MPRVFAIRDNRMQALSALREILSQNCQWPLLGRQIDSIEVRSGPIRDRCSTPERSLRLNLTR
jgi:hypothetical protein